MKLKGYPFALPSSLKKAMRMLAAAAQSNRSPCLLISFCKILSPACRPNEPATVPSLWRRGSVLPTRRSPRIGASTISPAAGNREQDLLQAPLVSVAGYLGNGVMGALEPNLLFKTKNRAGHHRYYSVCLYFTMQGF